MILGRRKAPGAWSRWLAIKSLITGIVMIPAVIVVKQYGLNVLAEQGEGLDVTPLPWVEPIIANFYVLPLPGLALAVFALILRPVRLPLAVLSLVLTLFGVLLVVAALVGSLAPFYQVPQDLTG